MSGSAEVLARHVSPDGALTLLVERWPERGGHTIIVGFEESGWHFHPDENEARRVVEAVLADQVVIIEWVLGDRHEFELMDDLALELTGGANGAVYRFRLWSRGVSYEDIAEGKVRYTPLHELWNWRTTSP